MDIATCLQLYPDDATKSSIAQAIRTLESTGFLDWMERQIKQGVMSSWDRNGDLQTARERLADKIMLADERITVLQTLGHFAQHQSGEFIR